MSALTEHQFAILGSVIVTVTTVVTLARLGIRTYGKNWGWDDTFALLAMLGDIGSVIGGSITGRADSSTSQTLLKFGYFLTLESYLTAIWLARISILFTIRRVTPSWPQCRGRFIAALLFAIISWAVLFGQVFWICLPPEAWEFLGPVPQCRLGLEAAITQIVTESIMDIGLVVAPLMMLRNLRASSATRFRLFIIFSVSLISTAAALVHGIVLVKLGGKPESIAGAIELSVTVMVCNATVLLPAVIRLLTRNGETSTLRSSNPNRPRISTLVSNRSTREGATSGTAKSSMPPGLDIERPEQDDLGYKFRLANEEEDNGRAFEMDGFTRPKDSEFM